MTITQYSMINHRRGLLVDLPEVLNSAELGYCVDFRRIFIGNGTLEEGAPIVGNTEIITNFTLLSNPLAVSTIYISNTHVIAQTGLTSNNPVVRSLCQRLDDRVSVKDFGAVGDGVTDDTDAINQALQNLYCVAQPGPYAAQMSYRALYFPAGVYIISDYIYFPPFAMIVGDGLSRTIISQTTSGKNCVFRTADSLFQNGLDLGTNSATLPTNVHIYGVGFQHVADQDIGRLERASNFMFEYCGFTGAYSGGSSTSSSIYLDKLGSVYTSSNIRFKNCLFTASYYAMNIDTNGVNANQIYIDDSNINNTAYGVFTQTAVSDIKLNNTILDTIANSGLVCSSTAVEVSSSNNTYSNSGNGTDGIISVISGAVDCSSINDKFISNSGPNIIDSGTNTIFLNNSTDFRPAIRSALTLLSGETLQPTGITFTLSNTDTAMIDYTIAVGGVNRVGRLFVTSDGTTGGTAFSDLYTDSSSGSSDIEFDFSVTGGVLSILYTSTNASNASWKTQVKSWLA